MERSEEWDTKQCTRHFSFSLLQYLPNVDAFEYTLSSAESNFVKLTLFHTHTHLKEGLLIRSKLCK
jgi:hypothetical protein